MTRTKRTPKIWWRTLTCPCWLINIVPYDSPPLHVKSLLALMFLSHSFPCFPLVCEALWKPTGCCLEQIMIPPIMYLMIIMIMDAFLEKSHHILTSDQSRWHGGIDRSPWCLAVWPAVLLSAGPCHVPRVSLDMRKQNRDPWGTTKT